MRLATGGGGASARLFALHLIEALFTGKEPGLLSTPLSKKWVSQISHPRFHRRLALILTRTGHGAKGKAALGRDAALLALVVVVILLAGQGQVAADISLDLVTTDLRPQQGGIPP